jgi:GT2 family glycosyltransferase/trans-aconitate methyltransferase
MDYYEGANGRLARLVPPAARCLLDLGCAAGRLGEQLKSQRPDRLVWGIEREPDIAAQAAERLDNVLVGDIEAMTTLPCPPAFFDVILCGDVLEHLRDPAAVLRFLRPYLAPHGRLLCSVPNVAHWSVLTHLLQGQFPYEDSGLLDRTHLHFFTPASFRQTLVETGYRVLGEESFSVPNLPVVETLTSAASALGLDAAAARNALAIYQQIFVAEKTRAYPLGVETRGQYAAPLVAPTPAPPPCSVVILTYNSMTTLPACLGTVLATLGPDDELFLIDNASTDGTVAHLRALEGTDPRLHIVCNSANLGYSAGANIGLRAARHEFVTLLNPDTLVYPGWLTRMQAHFQDETVGAVGPVSNYVAGRQFVGFHLPPDEPSPPREEPAALVAERNRGQAIETKLLIGFCLMLRRSVLERVGYLDESLFLGSDDLELSWRLRLAGYRLLIATEVYVDHKGGISFGALPSPTRQRLLDESTRALARKLEVHYRRGAVPTSVELWGIDIFPAVEE